MTQEEHTRFINLSRYYCHQLIISRDPSSKKAEREKALRQMELVHQEQLKLLETEKPPVAGVAPRESG